MWVLNILMPLRQRHNCFEALLNQFIIYRVLEETEIQQANTKGKIGSHLLNILMLH